MESVNHIFLHCCYSRDIWKEILNFWEIQWTFQENLVDSFLSWCSPFRGELVSSLWWYSFPHIFWGIWKESNDRIFRETSTPSWLIGKKIIRKLKENFISHFGPSTNLNMEHPGQIV